MVRKATSCSRGTCLSWKRVPLISASPNTSLSITRIIELRQMIKPSDP